MALLAGQLEIRPFRADDQAAARQLVVTGLGERWGWIDETLNPDLNDIAISYASGIFLVAYLDGQLVGTGALVPEVTPEGIQALRVVRMSVRADLRRQGLGRRILDALLDYVHARGCRLLVVETTSTWTDAVRFYARYGFQLVEEKDGETHMTLELEGSKMRLQGQVAIVTGGGRGIGRAIAKVFAQEGATVVLAELNGELGEATAQEIAAAGGKVRAMQTQVADRASVEAMVQATVAEFGRIDILVNNAAILGENGHVLEVSQEVWDRVIAVNQTGVFICSQAAGRVMAKARRGTIINIASVNSYVPQPRAVAYGAAKAAILAMTVVFAEDLAPYGIRINAIAPGPIQSDLPDDAPPQPTDTTLLGRAGLPNEIARVALFLACDDSSYINGQCITVDGGMLNNGYRIYDAPRPQL